MSKVLLTLLAALTLAACGGSATADLRPVPSRYSPTITADQLDAVRFPVLYDAIRAVRPAMVSGRGGVGGTTIMVEVNGAVMDGGIAALRVIRTHEVKSVTRVDDGSVSHGAVMLRVSLR